MNNQGIDTKPDEIKSNVPITTVQSLRNRVLQILLRAIIIVGTPMYAYNLIRSIQSNNIYFAIFITFAFIIVILLTFIRRIPYMYRTIGLLTIAFALIPYSFSLYGLSGDGRIWFLFFTLFSTIMLGLNAGLIANAIAILVFIFLGLFTISGNFTTLIPETVAYSILPGSWISTGLSLIFNSFVLTISTGLLIRSFDISLGDLQSSIDTENELLDELKSERGELEDKTEDLERRIVQIRAAAEIASSLGSILDPQELMQSVVDLLHSRFDLYYAGIFIVDDYDRFAILRAGSGEAGQRMMAEGHKLSVGGSSMIGWSVVNRRPRISQIAETDAIRYKNPHLPNTQSEVALPLVVVDQSYGERSLGAISIQSEEPNAFDNDDLVILQGIADSLSIALNNAHLFIQFESTLKEFQQLNRQYAKSSWEDIVLSPEESSFTFENPSAPPILDEVEATSIPLTLREGQVIGNISLESKSANWSDDELEFIEEISNQAAIALESARLLEESQKLAERERTMRELTTRLAQSLDFESLMQTIAKEIGQLPKVREAAIHIKPPELIIPNTAAQLNTMELPQEPEEDLTPQEELPGEAPLDTDEGLEQLNESDQ